MRTSLKYWCERRLRIAIEGPEGSREIVVEKPFARVGSHPGSEVFLPGAQIAQRGFYLHGTEQGVFCVDLVHAAATQRADHGWLVPERAVTLGPYKIRASLESTGPTPVDGLADLDARGTVVAPFPRLTVSIDGRSAARRRLRRRLTIIGRGKAATMRLMGSYVSATHCVMFWDRGALWVIDLLSANGTTFEGHRIEASPFPLGTSLMLGNVEVTFASLVGERVERTKVNALAVPSTVGASFDRGQPAALLTGPPPSGQVDLPTTCDGRVDPTALSEECAEELFSQVTDGLIKLSRKKRWRRRRKLVLALVTILALLSSSSLLAWRYWENLPGKALLDAGLQLLGK